MKFKELFIVPAALLSLSLATQVKNVNAADNNSTSNVTDINISKENFVGHVNYVKGYKVNLFKIINGSATYNGEAVLGQTNYKVFGHTVINGKKFYQLGTNQWIPEQYILQQDDYLSGSTTSRFVGKVVYKRSGKVALWKSNYGQLQLLGKYVNDGATFKVFASKNFNGRIFYNLGGNQWIDSQYLKNVNLNQSSNSSVKPVQKPSQSFVGLDKIYPYGSANHVLSHRGEKGSAEEHTFASYDLAVGHGSKFIEPDLKVSKNGTLFVSHDVTATRLTGVNRAFKDMSDIEINQLRTKGGSKILSLADIFTRYQKTVNYVPELDDYSGIGSLVQIIRNYGMQNNVIVQSTNIEVLHTLRQNFPSIKTLYLASNQRNFNAALTNPNITFIATPYQLMNKVNIDAAHNNGKYYTTWTLSYESLIKQAINLGVDNYFTDYTGMALNLEKNLRK